MQTPRLERKLNLWTEMERGVSKNTNEDGVSILVPTLHNNLRRLKPLRVHEWAANDASVSEHDCISIARYMLADQGIDS